MEYSRFEYLLKTREVTVYQVSKATGIAPSTFSDWKSGRSTPKADKLARIADFFSVSLDELLGTASGVRDAEASFRDLLAGKMVPVVNGITAGAPIVNSGNLIGSEFADVEDVADYFYLQTNDDSMCGAGIVRGSYVLFRKQQYAVSGDIAACLLDGDGAIVRRYEKHNHVISLIPSHPGHVPVTLSPEDFESGRARVLGVAIEVKTKFASPARKES